MSDEQKVWLGDSFEGLSCSRDELSGYAEGVKYLAYTAEEARKFAWQMIAVLAGTRSLPPSLVVELYGHLCSFCGKRRGEPTEGGVIRIVAGPGKVAICQECCALCNDILNAMVEIPTAEREKWVRYLVSLGVQQHEGKVTEWQACTLVDTWLQAIELQPNVMFPTCGVTDAGELYMRWAHAGRSLTLEILPAKVNWFFLDQKSGELTAGKEEGGEYPFAPPQFFDRLVRYFVRSELVGVESEVTSG